MFSIDRSVCVNCGQCVRACPMGIFRRGKQGVEVGSQKYCFHCMHCAAACPQKAVRVEGLPQEALYPAPPEDHLERLIKSRRSVRNYSSQIPPREMVEHILTTASWAPSSKNNHPYGWTILWGKEQTKQAARLVMEEATIANGPPELVSMARIGMDRVTCGAPCVLVCWARDDLPMSSADAVVVATTAELLLNNAGLSTCWAGYLTVFAQRSQAVRRFLEIPDGCTVYAALMVGYANKESYPNIPFRPAPPIRWMEG